MESVHQRTVRSGTFGNGEGCRLMSLDEEFAQMLPRPDLEPRWSRLRLDRAAQGTLHPARSPVAPRPPRSSTRISVKPPAASSPLGVDAKGVPKAASPAFSPSSTQRLRLPTASRWQKSPSSSAESRRCCSSSSRRRTAPAWRCGARRFALRSCLVFSLGIHSPLPPK